MSETKIKRVKLLNGDIYDIGVDSSNVNYDGSQTDIQGKDLTDALETIIGIAQENDNVIETVKVNGTALPVDSNKAVDVSVPTKTSELENDSDYLTPETLTYKTDNVVKSYPGTTTLIYPAANVHAVTGITYSTQAMYGTGTTHVFATASVSSDKVLSFGTTSVANNVPTNVVVSTSPSSTASVRDSSVTVLNGLGTPTISTVISNLLTETVQGKVVTFKNNNKVVSKFNDDLTYSQSLTPPFYGGPTFPYPPRANRNLLPYKYADLDGQVFIWENGFLNDAGEISLDYLTDQRPITSPWIKISAGAGETIYFNSPEHFPYGRSYTSAICFYDANRQLIGSRYEVTRDRQFPFITMSIPSNSVEWCRVSVTDKYSSSDNFQLHLDSENPNTFKPYQNTFPITALNTEKLYVSSKNLFINTDFTSLWEIDGSTTAYSGGIECVGDYCELKSYVKDPFGNIGIQTWLPSTAYTFSVDIELVSGSGTYSLFSRQFDDEAYERSEGIPLISGRNRYTFTFNTNEIANMDSNRAQTFELYFENTASDGIIRIFNPQLELGSTATSFESHDGNTYALEWSSDAGAVAMGTLDIKNQTLTKTHDLVELGFGAEWLDMTNNLGKKYLLPQKYRCPQTPISNLFTGIDPVTRESDLTTPGKVAVATSDNYEYLYFTTDAFLATGQYPNGNYIWADQKAWDVFVKETPIQVVLKLVTPEVYQVTNNEIEFLLGTNVLATSSGGELTLELKQS